MVFTYIQYQHEQTHMHACHTHARVAYAAAALHWLDAVSSEALVASTAVAVNAIAVRQCMLPLTLPLGLGAPRRRPKNGEALKTRASASGATSPPGQTTTTTTTTTTRTGIS